MILTCPQCGTQYVVKDDAIPPGGRQVRCASCKHSWHQDPEAENAEESAGSAAETSSEQAAVDAGDDLQVDVPAETELGQEPDPDHDDSNPQQQNWDDLPPPVWPEQNDDGAEDKVPAPPSGDDIEAGDKLRGEWFPGSDDEFGPFSTRDETSEGARRSPLLKVLVTVLVVVAIAVAFWFLAPPELKSRLGVAQAEREELQLTLTYQERQKLASGNELFVVTGRVINPTGETKPVPPIEAQIRTANGEVVYSWTIPAPASSIPPGGRAPFNSQETGVPVRDGQLLTIAFAAPAKNA